MFNPTPPESPATSRPGWGTLGRQRASAWLFWLQRPHGDSTAAPPPAWVWNGRIPCLDGLRAIAIFIGLFEHAHHTRGFDYPILRRVADHIAGLGPDIFFVISGFLITLLLIRERHRRGTVSLGAFYLRRALRLAPAFFCFLLVVFTLNQLGYIRVSNSDWVHVLTYTVNFQETPAWETGHLWSFSIEEQFYAVWPVTFILLGIFRARLTVALWLVVAPLLRLAVFVFHPTTMGHYETWTPLRADPIAAGSLLALCAVSPDFSRLTRTSRKTAMTVIVACASVIALSLYTRPMISIYDALLADSVEPLCLAVIVWLIANHSEGIVGTLLQSRAAVGIGTLAYSIFLWQQIYLDPKDDAVICRWPLNIVAATGTAIVSYFVIERPFLRLKNSLK